MTELRNLSFTGEPKDDARMSGENARDANAALDERVPAAVYGPVAYTAQGATTATIPVKCKRRPAGVLLLAAWASDAPSSDLGAVSRCNFLWEAETLSARVYEPNGLTSGTAYQLTFLVVG